ncbi:hotdog fold thioesterase [Pseudomonas asturiensis]|uniref:Hotdog fold thioesterase n=1 Tax=Pseudomonas asturiensis TaxID=1190415 RepID=A0ABX6HFV3_9PSED|nr:PaaI family thioesterase [Pseudomonas asturiensis]QHF04412.1 hotdog fold thioesterase [Pseudomonas asturiensis]
MQNLSREEKIELWMTEEKTVRATLGPPGDTGLAEVALLEPVDFFNSIGRGDLPSPALGALMGFIPLVFSEGQFIFQGTPDSRHYNSLGTVHGGYAATLLDSCMGCAIHTRLKKGQGYTTLDLRVSYIRALTDKVGPIRAEGKVVHVGRSTAVAEGRLYDVDDRLFATASTTCMILTMSM